MRILVVYALDFKDTAPKLIKFFFGYLLLHSVFVIQH